MSVLPCPHPHTVNMDDGSVICSDCTEIVRITDTKIQSIPTDISLCLHNRGRSAEPNGYVECVDCGAKLYSWAFRSDRRDIVGNSKTGQENYQDGHRVGYSAGQLDGLINAQIAARKAYDRDRKFFFIGGVVSGLMSAVVIWSFL